MKEPVENDDGLDCTDAEEAGGSGDSDEDSVSTKAGESKKKRKNKKKRRGKNSNNTSTTSEPPQAMQKPNYKCWKDHDAPSIGATNTLPQSDFSSPEKGTRAQNQQQISPSFVVPQVRFEEPKSSCLKYIEQKVFVSLIEKFTYLKDLRNMSENDRQDYEKLLGLKELVADEQKDFQEYAHGVFKACVSSRPQYLKTDIKRYIDEYYGFRLQRPNLRPRLYEKVDKIKDSLLRLVPPCNQQGEKSTFEMRDEKNLVEMGIIPKVLIPSRKRLKSVTPPVRVPNSYDRLCAKIQTDPNMAWTTLEKKENGEVVSTVNVQQSVDPAQSLHNVPVSQDPNAEKLAMTVLPTVVVSISAMKTIMNNFGPNYEATWMIPVSVRTYDKRDEEGKVLDVHKVIFVDKPLPPNSMSVREKNEWYHKVAAKAFLLHPWTKSKVSSKSGLRMPGADRDSIDADDPFSTEDIADFETFGNVSQMDGNNTTDSDDSDDENLVIADAGNSTEEPAEKKPMLPKAVPSPVRTLRSRTIEVEQKRERNQAPKEAKSSRRGSINSEGSCSKDDDEPKWSAKRLRTRVPSGEISSTRKANYGFVKREAWNQSKVKPVDAAKERNSLDFGSNEEESEGTMDNTRKVAESGSDGARGEINEVPACGNEGVITSAHVSNVEEMQTEEVVADTDSKKQQGEQEDVEKSFAKAISQPFLFEEEPEKEQSTSIVEQHKATSTHQNARRQSDHVSHLVNILERRKSEKREYHQKLKSNMEDQEGPKVQKGILGGIMAEQESLLIKDKTRGAQQNAGRLDNLSPATQYHGERVAFFDQSLKQEDFLQPHQSKNVAYRLFNLWNKASPNKSNLRVLVRSTTHGILRYALRFFKLKHH